MFKLSQFSITHSVKAGNTFLKNKCVSADAFIWN